MSPDHEHASSGYSLLPTSRVHNVSINIVTMVLVEVGKACEKFHDVKVRGLEVKNLQCAEIWSILYSKDKYLPEGMKVEAGDIWTWTALIGADGFVVRWATMRRPLMSSGAMYGSA